MAHRSIESIKTKDKLAGTLALGALSVGMAFMADAQAGARYSRSRDERADVISNIRPGEKAVFTVPGYHTNGRVIGKNLDRHFEHMGTTHYAVHPERGFNLDSIREAWLEARDKDGHRPAKIYAMSMGALLVAKLFSDDRFRQEFGEVDSLVIDSGLSGPEDVHLSSKLAMGLAMILPLTYTTGKLYNLFNRRDLHHVIDHAPEVLQSEAEEHIMSSSQTSFDAAKAQVMFMNGNDVDDMDLVPFGIEIDGNIIYLASPRDDVLNADRSSQQFSNALQRDIEYWTDTRRAPGSHATGPERPQGAIDALQYQNQDQYRINSIRHKFAKAASGLWVPQAA